MSHDVCASRKKKISCKQSFHSQGETAQTGQKRASIGNNFLTFFNRKKEMSFLFHDVDG